MASTSELEFNKHRSLELLNLPQCTEKEVRDFLVGVSIKNIQLTESRDSAIVNLAIGRQLEDAVQKYNGKQFKDNTVVTKPGANQHMIGVGHIPLHYTDKDFKDLCEKCSPVDYAYVMRTNKSGVGKGYGVVEFKADPQQVSKIKEELDWKEVDGQTLHADFIEASAQASYEQMQSKCLLLTGIPDTFTDVSKLREMFSCVTSPVYCQIIAKDDKTPGYGIIEYLTTEEAEETWLKMKNEKIDDADVVMSFCIPGKSAVVINNRITWKFGDKLQKSSLLPDPVTIKPVIAGNPMVISMTQLNPNLMKRFVSVLGELQQAYVSQMMSPVNKPGLLGPAPSLPLSPMMNPNMQLGLLAMLAIHLQIAKKEKFTGVLSKQLNTLNEQELGITGGPKPSILGDPMTGQANVILTSLKQQLNQVPLKDSDGNEVEEPTSLEEKLDHIEKKFVANGRYLNLSLLSNLGQLLVTMMQASGDFSPRPAASGPGLLNTPPLVKGQSLLGPMPGAGLMPPPSVGNKSTSLLGDAPSVPGRNPPLLGNTRGGRGNNANSPSSQGLLGSGRSNNLSQTILGQISQGLVNQIGQNIMYQLSVNQSKPNQTGGVGKGLLGDVPQGSSPNPSVPKSKPMGKNSLLGEPPNQYKGNQQSPMSSNLDQGSWKASDNRWGGASSYESGYGNKSNMGGNYNDYNYGQEAYTQDMGGNFGASGYVGGYGENDFYNSYQQQMYSMCDGTSGYYAEYSSSNFGSGTGYGSGTGAGNMGGGGGGNYGMGGGMLGNQASGVNFQDGQSFGKGSTSNGLGQDSGRYTMEGYGGNMGGMTNYSYSSGREDMGDGTYDSYRSVGMGGGYGTGMSGMTDNMSMGMSGTMTGMSGMSGMSGMTGMSGGSGMGSNTGMGGMGLMGTGNTMGGTGSMGMSNAFGNSYSTTSGMGGGSGSNNMMGTGSMTTGGGGNMGDSSYSTGMGASGRMGMTNMAGSGVSSSGSLGMMGNNGGYGSGSSSNKMTGMNNMSGMSNMSGFGVRDQNSSYYQTMGNSGGSGTSGLLPAPGKYLSPGQKRTYSQFLPNQESGTEGTDYVGQHTQGLSGHYMESFKRSRLY